MKYIATPPKNPDIAAFHRSGRFFMMIPPREDTDNQ